MSVTTLKTGRSVARHVALIVMFAISLFAGTMSARADNPSIGVGAQTVFVKDRANEKDAVVRVEFRADTPAGEYLLTADWAQLVRTRVKVRDWSWGWFWHWEWQNRVVHATSTRQISHRGGMVNYIVPLTRKGTNFTVTVTLAPLSDPTNGTSQTFQTGNSRRVIGVSFFVNPPVIAPPPPPPPPPAQYPMGFNIFNGLPSGGPGFATVYTTMVRDGAGALIPAGDPRRNEVQWTMTPTVSAGGGFGTIVPGYFSGSGQFVSDVAGTYDLRVVMSDGGSAVFPGEIYAGDSVIMTITP